MRLRALAVTPPLGTKKPGFRFWKLRGWEVPQTGAAELASSECFLSALREGSCDRFRLQPQPRDRTFAGATEARWIQHPGTQELAGSSSEPAQGACAQPCAFLKFLVKPLAPKLETLFPHCAMVSVYGDVHPPQVRCQVLTTPGLLAGLNCSRQKPARRCLEWSSEELDTEGHRAGVDMCRRSGEN